MNTNMNRFIFQIISKIYSENLKVRTDLRDHLHRTILNEHFLWVRFKHDFQNESVSIKN